ncbi:1,6-anhydro-N-acetylmuramyl-L-alanine amidase AmpD [Nitrincola alkalilacustris]|uniref:1,6-anhydro-N-acetylmuramyl-L-alanine amidase AmpD n=1 Tax=Nitrincola alkalilacustris TaxID=1571224 RepID=UPI00124C789C|nr:1,6-anhydro-N-acetylmuramyl-L-alanine amidase AmpD [Nitrincola alkalilacustris]
MENRFRSQRSRVLNRYFSLQEHLLVPAEQVASPNFNERPAGEVSLLVIHNISLPPGEFGAGYITDLFCNRLDPDAHPYFAEIAHLQVSAHLLITRTGRVVQYVPFDKRAWHAGASCFEGRDNCNDFSIGIELEGTDDTPYTSEQYDVLSVVTRALMKAYPAITPQRITGHCDIAPDRKTDPGPIFDWPRFIGSLQSTL